MVKTLIDAKLKFISNACDSLADVVAKEKLNCTSPMPDHIADEANEVLRELSSQARSLMLSDTLTMADYNNSARYVCDRFNKMTRWLFPGERMEL